MASLPRFLSGSASLRGLAAAVSLAALGLSCSGGAPAGDGMGGAPPTPGAESITFDPGETLLLSPGDLGEITVLVEPAGFHSVSFSLVASASDTAFDGFLEAANVVTDEDGVAHNQIHAPSSPAVFVVRASVTEELFATRTVSVSTEGFATLIVTPTYTGLREVEEWEAVASLGVGCTDLESLWGEGSLDAAGQDQEVTLADVPVGPEVALVVRAGEYIGGCVSVTDLAAGEERAVEVPVTDRPLQLSDAAFDLALDVEERTESFVALLGQAASDGAAAYAGDYEEDASVFLADFAQSIKDDSDRDAFSENAGEYGFTELTLARLAAPTALRDVVQSELIDAATLVDGPAVWVLSAELDESSSTLILSSAAGVPAAVSGFLGSSVLSVVREPGDRLVLGADLEFQATRWLGAIAESDETSAEGGDMAPLARLEAEVDCEALAGDWLGATGADLYPACGELCAVTLCENALQMGWDRARTTGKDLTTLRVGISGQAEIDDQARPIGLSGDWVGSIDSNELSVAGAATSP
jgi:hypothetical protein